MHIIVLLSSPVSSPTLQQDISVPVKDIQVQEKLMQEQLKKVANIKHQRFEYNIHRTSGWARVKAFPILLTVVERRRCVRINELRIGSTPARGS